MALAVEVHNNIVVVACNKDGCIIEKLLGRIIAVLLRVFVVNTFVLVLLCTKSVLAGGTHFYHESFFARKKACVEQQQM